jgi:LacI family transcriptional regulator
MKYATIQDIALKAGKSVATVSRVLNGKARKGIPISDETAEQILRIAAELDYRPNLVARNLVGRDSRVVGLIIPDIMQSFFNEICYHLSRELDRDGYDLILSHSYENPDAERRSIEMLLSRRVSGIIIAPAMGHKNIDALSGIRKRGIPFILLDRYYPGENFHSVSTGDVEGFRVLTEHLVAQGARRIMFVAGNRETSVSIERIEGYRKALASRGIGADDDLLIESGYFMEDGYSVVRTLIERGVFRDVDAVAGVNDAVAIGIMTALEEAGKRIPEDILVAGYANDRYSGYFRVPLTTVEQPKRDIAGKAHAMLMKLIKGEEVAVPHERVPCSLVVRDSTLVKGGAPV